MDNWYSAPELFAMLKTKYKILACGTNCTNRKCWDPKQINLLKSETRRESKTCSNPINRIMFGQWKDNKGGKWYNYATVWE